MAKQIDAHKLTADQAHMAMVASGWTPLVTIGTATHWVKDGRAAVVAHEQPADTPLEQNRVSYTRFVAFTQLESGEILAL